jgi:REP element-mobilizing transposase RayT
MNRERRTHVQQELFKPRGGKRSGAGRPPKGRRAGSPHKKRPALRREFPVHVTLRVHPDFVNLRKRHLYKALREATITVALRELNTNIVGAFRIIHISIQHNHVHMLVEADHAQALSRGMQVFQISAAKHLNAAISIDPRWRTRRRRGAVFPDRFHEEIITCPRQARNALSYVLNNWRKHREDRARFARAWCVDPYSTGVQFPGWKEREHEDFMWKWRATYQPMVVYLPKTWLLQEGWKLSGPIRYTEIPSSSR